MYIVILMAKNEVLALRRRALEFLEEAREAIEKRRYDLSVFFSEQSVQLYLKSLILELIGEIPRTHSIRELLGFLRKIEGIEVDKFIKTRREALIALEDAYLLSRYFLREYNREEAERLYEIAVEAIKFAEKFRRYTRD